jgi:hypothetical protein
MLSKHEALSSNPNPTKKNKKKKSNLACRRTQSYSSNEWNSFNQTWLQTHAAFNHKNAFMNQQH